MDIFAQLETSGLPAYRQGSFSEDKAYPEKFWTVWETEANDVCYDNKPVTTIRAFSVCFYSCDPKTARADVLDMIAHLREQGYACTPPTDTMSDEVSHIGYAFDAILRM